MLELDERTNIVAFVDDVTLKQAYADWLWSRKRDWLRTGTRWLGDVACMKTKNNARFHINSFYLTLTIFHLYSSLSSRIDQSARSLLYQSEPTTYVNQSVSACFNVTFIYKYHDICSFIPFKRDSWRFQDKNVRVY